MDAEQPQRPNMRKLFKGQSERAYIFGKLERLAHAIVLILSQTGSAHPVVDRLETTVLDSIREAAAGASELEQSFLVSIVLEIVSLVRIASTAGVISERNASILTSEYLALLEKLSQPSVQGMLLRAEDLLSDADANTPNELSLPSPIGALFSVDERGQVNSRNGKREEEMSNTKIFKGQRNSRPNPQRTLKDTSVFKKNDRSQRIIDIVTAKGIVSIRDVASVITDCSEKTLQRELLALVDTGILKKEGERRWSTYRLA